MKGTERQIVCLCTGTVHIWAYTTLRITKIPTISSKCSLVGPFCLHTTEINTDTKAKVSEGLPGGRAVFLHSQPLVLSSFGVVDGMQ